LWELALFAEEPLKELKLIGVSEMIRRSMFAAICLAVTAMTSLAGTLVEVIWSEVQPINIVVFEDYLSVGRQPAASLGMEVWAGDGTDLSDPGTINFTQNPGLANEAVAVSPNSKPCVFIHNNTNVISRVNDVLAFTGWGPYGEANSFLAQVGTTWYVSDVLPSGWYGTVPSGPGSNNPDKTAGYSTADTVWHVFHEGDFGASGFTTTIPTSGGTALPPGDIVNTGMLMNGSHDAYVRTFAITSYITPEDVYYVASTPTDWTDSLAWSDGLAATNNNFYYVTNNVVLNTPATTATFPGLSLILKESQRLEIMASEGDVVTVSGLILDAAEIAPSVAGSGEAQIDGKITLTSSSTFAGATDNSRDLRVQAQVVVGDDATLTLNAPTKTIYIDNTGNNFSGTWAVSGGTAEFAGAAAVGTADIEVQSTGTLRVSSDWDGYATGASLTVADSSTASVDIGSYQWTVSNLVFGATAISNGTYTASELNAKGANSVFTGSGTIRIGELVIEANSLAAHWSLDEGFGLIANDSSGYAFHGSILNGATWITDDPERGTCISFDGTNDRIETDFMVDITSEEKDFTWAVWANSQQAAGGSIIIGNRYPQFGGATDNNYNFLKLTPGNVGTGMSNSLQPIDFEDMVQNEWHHHAIVKSGSSLQYYRDGNAVTNITLTSYMDGEIPFYIGGEPEKNKDTEHFQGLVDDVVLYNYALAPENVTDVMNGLYVFGEPIISVEKIGADLKLSWAETGFKLQTKSNLALDNWNDYPGGETSPVTVPATNDVEFLRLIKQ